VNERPIPRPMLETLGLTKRFQSVLALDSVDFAAYRGEVRAIVGANGAGKSTLMNLLAGVFPPTAGEVRIDGESVHLRSPRDAAERGIAVVYQEFSSIPVLSAVENITLGREPVGALGRIDRARMLRDAENLCDRYGLKIRLTQRLEEMSVADRQLVEVARALAAKPRVLILDEPTAVLSGAEQEALFAIVRRFQEDNLLVLFVSHRLAEVFAIAERASVLRDGRLIGTVRLSDSSHDHLIEMMVGATASAPRRATAVLAGKRLLKAARSHVPDVVPLTVSRGEIVGLAGMVGSGRSRLGRGLCGIGDSGGIAFEIEGRPVRIRSPREALAHGLAYLTEDRKEEGLFASLSVLSNATAARLDEISSGGLIIDKRERRNGAAMLERLNVVAASLDAPVQRLSGGNQQKVLFGRVLLAEPRLLVCDEPTRGVDARGRNEIHRILADLAGRGVAIVLITSELEELVMLSDRVLVMRDGAIAGELQGSEITEAAIVGLAAGSGSALTHGGAEPCRKSG
jgi:ABC-type sugar transport system ATPase subunit